MKTNVLVLLITIVVLFNAGCVQPEPGVTHLDGQNTDHSVNEFEDKVDLHLHDETFTNGVNALKKELISRNKGKASKAKTDKEGKRLKIQYDKQSILNLKKLGVYNIEKRLNTPLGKYNKYNKKKKDVFVKKVSSEADRLGGKLVCNKQVLTFRIDRSIFISCMENHDDVSDFSISKLFVNYNLMNIMQHQINDTPSKCKIKLAVSHNSYNDLAECLITDRANGGFFKFRNPNSLSYKFKIIKEKNER